jgi:hypothetical protein
MGADGDCLHPIRQAFLQGTIAGSLYHLRRPIGRCYVMSDPSHADGIEPGSATQIDQSAGCSECGVQTMPHFPAHSLNQVVVAAWPVIVRGNAVKCVLSVAQVAALRSAVAELGRVNRS